MKWFEALPVPIALATGGTNPAFRALTGMDGPWPETVHLADRERVEAAVARARVSRERVQLETRFRDGRAVRFHQFTDTRGWVEALGQ